MLKYKREIRFDPDSPPFVSVILPSLNEGPFVARCLRSICAGEYPRDRMEVLVCDGLSTDETRPAVEQIAHRDRRVRLIDNPKRITPGALNAGIRAARGDVVVRMDMHAKVEPDYIRRCVEALLTMGADNVGGNMRTVPQTAGAVGKSVAAVLSHPFGVGGSFRVEYDRPTPVITVFGGCYRKEVFDIVGSFNEALPRGQDIEFNLRLRRMGGVTLLVPDIVSYYYARSELISFCAHNWKNGVWAILPFLGSAIMPVSWRHLVPMACTATAIVLVPLSLVDLRVWVLLAGLICAYALMALIASVRTAVRLRNPLLLLLMPPLFLALHSFYGAGSCCAAVSNLRGLAKRLLFGWKGGGMSC